MILFDYNHLVIEACSGSLTRVREINPTLVRHIFLQRMGKILGRYKGDYGMAVICREGLGNWRKESFPQYKAARAEGRKSSGFDWKSIYAMGDLIATELHEVFHFPILIAEGYEADDAIASVVRTFPERHLIVSRDKDFLQLRYFGNVDQLDVIAQRFKELPEQTTLDEFFVSMIIKGQSKDGVPSIFSEDNRLVDRIRQKPISKKMIEACVNLFEGNFDVEKMLHMIRNADAFQNILKSTGISDEEIRHNMSRNLKINSLLAPIEEYDRDVLDILDSHSYSPDTNAIMQYFSDNKLIEVSGSVGDFIYGGGGEAEESDKTEQERWGDMLGVTIKRGNEHV